MDRTLAPNYTTVGGKRQYQDLNLAAGQQGTGLMAADRTATQEELVAGFIEGAGIVPAAGTLNQAAQGARRMAGANFTSITTAGTTTLTADNAGLVTVNATAGNVTIDLPAVNSANGVPFGFLFVRTDSTTNTVTFAAAGADTFASVAWQTIAAPSLLPGAPVDLRGDGVSHWLEMPPRVRGSQLFLAAGTYTVPSGVTAVYLSGTAPGGGGAGAYSSTNIQNAGAGGSSGMSVFRERVTVTPGQAIAVSLGSPGSGGAASTTQNVNSGSGGNGGTLSFGSLLTLTGGQGGGNSGASNPGAGGASVGIGSVVGSAGSGIDLAAACTMAGGAGGSSVFGSYGVGGNGGLATQAPAAAPGLAGGVAMLLVEW
jgi:hypothetical protein